MTCGACGHIHESTWARAVGRFNPEQPTTYRAQYQGAPTRDSRSAAELDMCANYQHGSSND